MAGDLANGKKAKNESLARAREGMEDFIRSAIRALAPRLSEKAAIRRIKDRLGEPGRDLLKSFEEEREE